MRHDHAPAESIWPLYAGTLTCIDEGRTVGSTGLRSHQIDWPALGS